MHTNGPNWIDELIDAQEPGYSLAQAFYRDPAIFDRDRERVFRHHWILAGHVSQIPQSGDYLLFDMAGESIIIIRDREGAVHAHYNVCRHRGSRVLSACAGNARTITCRYHGWSYAHDGALKVAHQMPEGFDRSRYGLKPCHMTIIEGLMFINLSEGEPPGLAEVAGGLEPFLRLHGIAGARVAHRDVFPVHANWKLVVENYLECYHCRPAHPQYCQVEIKAEKTADGSPAALAKYEARRREWLEQAERFGTTMPEYSTELPLDARLRHAQFATAYRAPLRDAYASGTQDGQPAAPLMGRFTEYDGGETALGLGPFTYMLAYNDHAVFFQFVPSDTEHSEIIVSWLVREDAREGEHYELPRLTWLWTVTTEQDKAIIEANAAGIRSSRYEPGPASLLESDVTGFREWYLAVSGPDSRLNRLSRGGGGRYFGL